MASEAISPPGWRRLETRAPVGGSPGTWVWLQLLIFQVPARPGNLGQQKGHRGTLPSSDSWSGGLNEDRAHVCSCELDWAYGLSPANSDSRSSVKLQVKIA